MKWWDRYDALLCAACVAVFVLAAVLVLVFTSPAPRPQISNDSTYQEVVANFAGKPYSTGQFVSGYTCAGYTAGKDGHGWVVIRCSK